MIHARKLSIFILSGIAFISLVCLEAGANGAREARSIREVKGFDSVIFYTSGELVITQGDREALEITARESDLANIVTEVRGGTLYIGREETGSFFHFSSPVFRLAMKTIAGLEVHSSGRISADKIRADSLRIRISSSGDISIYSLYADSLEVRISSSGTLRAAGRVDRQEILLSSSGSYSGGKLESRTAKVRVSSSGTATLRVSDVLEADLTSSGGVRYYGSPKEVKEKVTSSGRLVGMGN